MKEINERKKREKVLIETLKILEQKDVEVAHFAYTEYLGGIFDAVYHGLAQVDNRTPEIIGSALCKITESGRQHLVKMRAENVENFVIDALRSIQRRYTGRPFNAATRNALKAEIEQIALQIKDEYQYEVEYTIEERKFTLCGHVRIRLKYHQPHSEVVRYAELRIN